jgi:long-chain acyl-CoA synthetase
MKLIDLLANSAASQPNAIAIKTGDVKVSYRKMFAAVQTLSEQLKCAGCSRGVTVAIVLTKSAEYLISFFAIPASHGTILPLTARMTPHEVINYANRADASIIITSKAYGERLVSEVDGYDKISVISVCCDPVSNLEVEVCVSGRCTVGTEDSDVALMVPTSGTTGLPKIVMLTDDNLISNMAVYRLLMGFEGHGVVYCGLSLHHIYCICAQIITHVSLADTFVIWDKPFFIRDFFKSVERYGVTATAFVPYMAILMAEYPNLQEFDLETLKYVTISGAKMPKATYRLLTEKFNKVHFVNTYGMSEAGSRISIAAPFSEEFPVDSVGKPMPGVKVRIVDDKGRPTSVGCPGEIVIQSSGITKGYYKQPVLTAETIVNGWLKTGDIGKIDENGNLFIVGRTKEMILTGGENVSPFEIEECLVEHPAILEAAVVAQRDRLLQEVPFAFVVKRQSENLATRDIIKFCSNKLSSYKIPRSVRFMNELPKLGNSKIDRRLLRKMAQGLPEESFECLL